MFKTTGESVLPSLEEQRDKVMEVVIHVLPQEILMFQQLTWQLKRCSRLLSTEQTQQCSWTLSAVLNCRLIDWERSQLPRSFVVRTFERLADINRDWATVSFSVSRPEDQQVGDSGVSGVNDWRRLRIQQTTAQALVFIDPDIVFGDALMTRLTSAYLTLTCAQQRVQSAPDGDGHEPFWVVTPQCPPMWDTTWSVLTPESQLQAECSLAQYQARDPFACTGSLGEAHLRELPAGLLKWGGGLCTMYSTALLRYATIPPQLGSYGQDDFAVMLICLAMQQQSASRPELAVHQYVLVNETVTENCRFRLMIDEPDLTTATGRSVADHRKQANAVLKSAVRQFCQSLPERPLRRTVGLTVTRTSCC
jgi:hypothetical protein